MKHQSREVEATTLPKNLPPKSVVAMLRSRAEKKGFRLGPWTYNPKTGRATFAPG